MAVELWWWLWWQIDNGNGGSSYGVGVIGGDGGGSMESYAYTSMLVHAHLQIPQSYFEKDFDVTIF